MWKQSERLRFLTLCLVLIPSLATYAADGMETFGAGVDLGTVTPIADILADPDSFIGTTVRIEGGVLEVCPAKGCWMEVGNVESKIRVKVEDDVIMFPRTAEGKIASAQGVVEAVELDRERYVAWLTHLAEERGETFDAETSDLGDGAYRIIQIRGTGAKIGKQTADARD